MKKFNLNSNKAFGKMGEELGRGKKTDIIFNYFLKATINLGF